MFVTKKQRPSSHIIITRRAVLVGTAMSMVHCLIKTAAAAMQPASVLMHPTRAAVRSSPFSLIRSAAPASSKSTRSNAIPFLTTSTAKATNAKRQQQWRPYSGSQILQMTEKEELAMENLYMEWTLEDDKLLWENRKESLADLAVLLGRGLRGVEARLSKLSNINHPAYERLFPTMNKRKKSQQHTSADDDDDEEMMHEKKKLVPVSEVLRRIRWDQTLQPSDFFILHYDRVEDTVVESPVDAPNESIAGKDTQLIDALPEHRIVAVKYKEQVVWDREKRLDRFFSSSGNGGIEAVMENYDEWKRREDQNKEYLRQRQSQVSTQVQQILGHDRYALFKSLSNELQLTLEDGSYVPAKQEAEQYVEAALNLFRGVQMDPSASLEPSLIPRSDIEAVEILSQLVSLSPSVQLRQHVLDELTIVLDRLNNKQQQPSQSVTQVLNRELPDIPEDEMTETFVRGSGPGGQKINKTNNKVLLVHKPTQLRVECQDTRSLQQNRKIARKRLRIKLDELLNGSQSKNSVKADMASSKKAKAKARAKARLQKKAAAKLAGKDDAKEKEWGDELDEPPAFL